MGWHWGILAGSGAGGAGAYELISTTVLGSDTASVSFNSIPQTYKHVQIRVAARTTFTGGDLMQMRWNSDTAANYSYHALRGDGGSVGSIAGSSTSTMYMGRFAYNTTFGAWVCDVLDYSATSKYKTAKALSGVANFYVEMYSGSWRNTAAITGITLLSANGGNFVTGSRFSLYGIKG
jgi:hypothetical protein